MSPHPKLRLGLKYTNPVNMNENYEYDSEIRESFWSVRVKPPTPDGKITEDMLDDFAFELCYLATRRESLRSLLEGVIEKDPKEILHIRNLTRQSDE